MIPAYRAEALQGLWLMGVVTRLIIGQGAMHLILWSIILVLMDMELNHMMSFQKQTVPARKFFESFVQQILLQVSVIAFFISYRLRQDWEQHSEMGWIHLEHWTHKINIM